jgi:aminoglycoside phosphotransferase family enzyme
MDNKIKVFDKVDYQLTIRMIDVMKYPSETNEDFEERIKKEGKKRASYYLSGYLLDLDNKVVFESIKLGDE